MIIRAKKFQKGYNSIVDRKQNISNIDIDSGFLCLEKEQLQATIEFFKAKRNGGAFATDEAKPDKFDEQFEEF